MPNVALQAASAFFYLFFLFKQSSDYRNIFTILHPKCAKLHATSATNLAQLFNFLSTTFWGTT